MAIPDHIRRLRERVGTELLLVPCVAVLARDEHGRVLLVRNAEFGVWTLPGGMLELDEVPEQAAAREALEEAGLEVEVGAVLGVFGGPEYRTTYRNGDEVSTVVAVFAARPVGGSARPDGDETSAVGWFSPHELESLEMLPRLRDLLARLFGAP